ncbi:hypothetical protein OAS86_00410 [Gammaproteobacteria bacterium]|nr:hypothetical protein [Gammaproteobacteria bacterium]
MLSSTPLLALEVGEAELQSNLFEPLKLSIPLSGSNAELDNLRIRLASNDEYRQLRIPRGRFRLGSLDPVLVELADGRLALELTSNDAISEPFFDLLLAFEWPGGRKFRQFPVNLQSAAIEEANQSAPSVTVAPLPGDGREPASPAADPIQTSVQVQQAPVPQTSRVSETAPSRVPQPTPTTTAPSPAPPRDYQPGQTVTVQRGNSLWDIAERVDGGDVSPFQAMVAIAEANPQAFSGGNINLMRHGEQLQIPSQQQLSERSKQSAARRYERLIRNIDSLNVPVTAGSAAASTLATQTLPPDTPVDNQESRRLRIVQDRDGTQGGASSSDGIGDSGVSELRDRIRSLEEELFARNLENNELRDRIGLLETSLETRERILQLQGGGQADVIEPPAIAIGNRAVDQASIDEFLLEQQPSIAQSESGPLPAYSGDIPDITDKTVFVRDVTVLEGEPGEVVPSAPAVSDGVDDEPSVGQRIGEWIVDGGFWKWLLAALLALGGLLWWRRRADQQTRGHSSWTHDDEGERIPVKPPGKVIGGAEDNARLQVNLALEAAKHGDNGRANQMLRMAINEGSYDYIAQIEVLQSLLNNGDAASTEALAHLVGRQALSASERQLLDNVTAQLEEDGEQTSLPPNDSQWLAPPNHSSVQERQPTATYDDDEVDVSIFDDDLVRLDTHARAANQTNESSHGGPDFGLPDQPDNSAHEPDFGLPRIDVVDDDEGPSLDHVQSSVDSNWSRLRLARGYHKAGDFDGAERLLQQVMNDGSPLQQSEASDLLAIIRRR